MPGPIRQIIGERGPYKEYAEEIDMKLFQIAGVAVAAAALAACGSGATEENVASTDNVALEGENLDANVDLNATDLNAVDANAGNEADANAADNAAAADNASNAQ